jgi:hypothetical protein
MMQRKSNNALKTNFLNFGMRLNLDEADKTIANVPQQMLHHLLEL